MFIALSIFIYNPQHRTEQFPWRLYDISELYVIGSSDKGAPTSEIIVIVVRALVESHFW